MVFQRFDTSDSSTLKDLRLLAMCSSSYSGFLRYDELSNLKANNLTFSEDYLDIFVEKSKTDCYSNGKNVLITKSNNQYCPVSIFRVIFLWLALICYPTCFVQVSFIYEKNQTLLV